MLPLQAARTELVEFDLAPFPYEGRAPSGKPFLDVTDEDGRRGHRTWRGRVLWEDVSFSDNRALVHIPRGFDARRPGLIVVFLHGHRATLERDVRDRQKVADQKIANVQPTLGKFAEPGLPAASVDLAFIHDVLHHIQDRAGYLKALSRALKPTGRLALIEFHPDKGGHRNQAEMHVTKDQAAAWMADAGLKPVEEFELFPEKYFVIYGRR